MVHFGLEKSFNTKSKGFVRHGNVKNPLSKKHFLIDKLVEFCKRTDLHGFKYIVMKDFNVFERSCWGFAVILSVVIATWFVIMAYQWYARNPIVTVIESTQGAIWDVPFPAVTICDLNIVSRKAALNFTKTVNLPENMTEEFVFKTLKLIPVLFSSFPSEPEQRESLQKLQVVLDLNNITIDNLIKQVSNIKCMLSYHPQLSPASLCMNLVQKCMWKNTVYPCDELFKPIFTLLGQCCTFNYYAVEDLESKINHKTGMPPAPRRVASCGYQTALTVLLYTDLNDYYSATIASQGALVMIDSAYNIPDLDSPVRMVNPLTEVLIAVSAERTYATEGIENFLPQERQCFYSHEWQIGGLRQYSFHNCMAYEKVQLLLKNCDCAPISFPTRDIHQKCDFKDLYCIDRTLRLGEFKNNSNSRSKCLPECEHYDYPLEVALGKLADTKYVNNVPFFDGVRLNNHSLLNVFFNDLVSTRYRRDVYLNWQNILAAFGGLLSLMLGFTLIAGFNLVLFFTFTVTYDYFMTTPKELFERNKISVQDYRPKNSWVKKSDYPISKAKRLQSKDGIRYGFDGHNKY